MLTFIAVAEIYRSTKMAHYALLDENNIVTRVINGIDEDNLDTLPSEFSSWEEFYSDFHGCTVKRTSYNTHRGEHDLGGTPFRKNYAGKGWTYDSTKDAFIRPKPNGFDSWIYDEDTGDWKSPIPYPDDGISYYWDEASTSWQVFDTPPE